MSHAHYQPKDRGGTEDSALTIRVCKRSNVSRCKTRQIRSGPVTVKMAMSERCVNCTVTSSALNSWMLVMVPALRDKRLCGRPLQRLVFVTLKLVRLAPAPPQRQDPESAADAQQ